MSAATVQGGGVALGSRARQVSVSSFVFALYCYFLIDYYVRFSARLPGYGSIHPTLLLGGLLVIAAFAQGERVRELFRQPPVQMVAVLIVYVLATLPVVEWPGSVLRDNLNDFIKAALFIFFTALFVDTDRRLKITVFLFIALQAFRVLEPLYLYWSTGVLRGYTYVEGAFEGRLSGAPADVINANGLGFVIVTTLGFMHFIMLGSPRRLVRWLYFALLPLFLYALELTASRGGFIVLLVLAFFMFRESRHKALFVILGIAVAIGGWMQMSDFSKTRYLSLIGGGGAQESSVEGRLDLIMLEFRLGLTRPIVGHGVGTTSEAKVNELGRGPQASHNLYGELLIEIGMVGALIFLTFLWRNYQLLQRNLRRFRKAAAGRSIDSFQYRLNQALFAIFWVYAVYSLNYYGLSREYWYLFGGLCVAFARSIERTEAAEQPHDEIRGAISHA